MWKKNWKAETLPCVEGVTLSVKNEAPEGWASFDSRQMKQALLHLLRNALEAKAPGRDLALEVATFIEPASEFFPIAQLVTTISDTGTGIKPEVFDFIFDPRFTTKGERASGLGLSLAYQTLNRHGGSLLAQSEVDKGSVFTLKLPLEEIPEYLR
jgi:signal transduction histidine kinase